MRCDVNVSVRKPGADLGTRCEIKNVNSIRFVAAAIEYEARRQIDILEDGGTIDQETRLYDPKTGEPVIARPSLLRRPNSSLITQLAASLPSRALLASTESAAS